MAELDEALRVEASGVGLLPELRVWRALAAEVARGRPAVLVAVVSHTRSSPGRTGWLMAVGSGGWLAGTTGGGAAEEQAIQEATVLLVEVEPKHRLLTQTHRTGSEHASGLLCGGEQVLALVPLAPSCADRLTVLDRALTRGDTGTWTISPDGLRLGGTSIGFTEDGDGWSFTQVSGPTHHVVVVGAGHVGEALARTLVPLGFRVSVVDERPGAAARLADLAHDVVEQRYEQLAAVVPVGERTLVAIATHAPDRDAAAVAALADVPLGYLGVLGSRAKLAILTPQAQIRAPMGLPIGSHTPEEIAVSVAAELVALRTQRGATPVS